MKILTIGFLVFSGWSVFSAFIYVCKIKGLCDDPIAMGIEKDILAEDSIPSLFLREQSASPKDLNIYFAFDNDAFTADAEAEKFFDASRIYLDQNVHNQISIIGYTDAIGSDEYNQALGYRRAQSISYYFNGRGIPANRISMESRGEKDPADDNKTEEGRANNRRTEITLKK